MANLFFSSVLHALVHQNTIVPAHYQHHIALCMWGSRPCHGRAAKVIDYLEGGNELTLHCMSTSCSTQARETPSPQNWVCQDETTSWVIMTQCLTTDCPSSRLEPWRCPCSTLVSLWEARLPKHFVWSFCYHAAMHGHVKPWQSCQRGSLCNAMAAPLRTT